MQTLQALLLLLVVLTTPHKGLLIGVFVVQLKSVDSHLVY